VVGGKWLWGLRSFHRCRSPRGTAAIRPRCSAELVCSITSILVLMNSVTAKVVVMAIERDAANAPEASHAIAVAARRICNSCGANSLRSSRLGPR